MALLWTKKKMIILSGGNTVVPPSGIPGKTGALPLAAELLHRLRSWVQLADSKRLHLAFETLTPSIYRLTQTTGCSAPQSPLSSSYFHNQINHSASA